MSIYILRQSPKERPNFSKTNRKVPLTIFEKLLLADLTQKVA